MKQKDGLRPAKGTEDGNSREKREEGQREGT